MESKEELVPTEMTGVSDIASQTAEISTPPVQISEEADSITSLDMLEPKTELGATLIALAKEIDESGIPKLSFEEIEEYLGRKLGGIAEALER